MQPQNRTRRERGDGSLFLRPTAKGGETWIGFFRVDGRGVMRTVGKRRSKVYPDGLSKPQAEAAFKRLRDEALVSPSVPERRTLAEVGAEMVRAKVASGRKRSTVESIESAVRIHIVPFFGAKPVHKIDRDDVRRFSAELLSKRLSPKTALNVLGILHSLIDFAIDEGWRTSENPVKRVAKPRSPEADADIRFLEPEEVEALIRAVPDDTLGRVERVMYLTAAMTGMRQGELFALRWRDVDWTAKRIRVRRNFVRGEFGTPKSRRSSRSVPLASRVATELDRLFVDSPHNQADDLVFAHPQTGKPIDRSKLLKRFKSAIGRAEVGRFETVRNGRGVEVRRSLTRFHDLRHTFGTRMAAQGVPMRVLQEMMGHRDFKTTLIYADYAPGSQEAEWVEDAFAPGQVVRLATVETTGQSLDA